jgi:hypothetical protein
MGVAVATAEELVDWIETLRATHVIDMVGDRVMAFEAGDGVVRAAEGVAAWLRTAHPDTPPVEIIRGHMGVSVILDATSTPQWAALLGINYVPGAERSP